MNRVQKFREAALMAKAELARRERDLKAARSLPKRVRDELEHFFVAATVFEGKDPRILGWAGVDAALDLIRKSSRARRRT